MLRAREKPQAALGLGPPARDAAVLAQMLAAEPPHYHEHRMRLRARFLEAGTQALADYELLELVLFRAIPRRDVKPLAKALLARFGSFAEVICASRERLQELSGLGEAAIAELKIVQAAAGRLARDHVRERHVWTSAITSSPTSASRSARWTTPRSIRARWSSARSSSPPPP
jgi:hypothetical protein